MSEQNGSVVVYEVLGNKNAGKSSVIAHLKRLLCKRQKSELEFHFVSQPYTGMVPLVKDFYSDGYAAAGLVLTFLAHFYFKLVPIFSKIEHQLKHGKTKKHHVIVTEESISTCINVYIPLARALKLFSKRESEFLLETCRGLESKASELNMRTYRFFLNTDSKTCYHRIYRNQPRCWDYQISEKQLQLYQSLNETWAYTTFFTGCSFIGRRNEIIEKMFYLLPRELTPLSHGELMIDDVKPDCIWGLTVNGDSRASKRTQPML